MFGKDKKDEEKASPKLNESPGNEKKAPAEPEEITLKKSDYEALIKNKDEAKKEAEDWKNKYYLNLADTQNLRKSLEKDHSEAIRYRSEGFLEGLLPSLDSFYIALEADPSTPEAKNYKIGFQYIYNQIESVLFNEGVSEIAPKAGDKFDPSYMHAVDTTVGEKEGLVSFVHAKGYRLHDRLVRPAMVNVTKLADQTPEAPKAEEEKKEDNTEAKKA